MRAVITGEAPADKNTLTTASLTVQDIENHSDYSAETKGWGVEIGDGKGSLSPSLPMEDSGSDSSVTRSAIAEGTVTITDEARQQELTGQSADDYVAALNRDTANAHQGPLDHNPDLGEILSKQAEIVDAAGQAGPAVAKTVGDIAKYFSKEYDDALLKAKDAELTLSDPKASSEEKALALANLEKAASILENPEVRAEWEKWQEGGIYKVILQAVGAALVAEIGNGEGLNAVLGAAASQLAPGQIREFSRDIAKQMSDDLGTQQLIANILSNAVSNAIGGAVGGESGAAMASTMDRNNRQLHPKEIDWIMANAELFVEFVCQNDSTKCDMPLEQAKRILMRQALIQVDSEAEYNFRVLAKQLNYNIPFVYDYDALNFLSLAQNQQLQNASGDWQDYFTAPGGQREDALYFIDYYDPAKNKDAGKYRDLVLQYAAFTAEEKVNRPGVYTKSDLNNAFKNVQFSSEVDIKAVLAKFDGKEMLNEADMLSALSNMAKFLHEQGYMESYDQAITFIYEGGFADILRDKAGTLTASYEQYQVYYDKLFSELNPQYVQKGQDAFGGDSLSDYLNRLYGDDGAAGRIANNRTGQTIGLVVDAATIALALAKTPKAVKTLHEALEAATSKSTKLTDLLAELRPGYIGDKPDYIDNAAHNLSNYQKLINQLHAEEISNGHAFQKHVIDQSEFLDLGIYNQKQFTNHIEKVLNNPTDVRTLANGRSAYWHEPSQTVVILNPKALDGGTAFRPTNGREYFDSLY